MKSATGSSVARDSRHIEHRYVLVDQSWVWVWVLGFRCLVFGFFGFCGLASALASALISTLSGINFIGGFVSGLTRRMPDLINH